MRSLLLLLSLIGVTGCVESPPYRGVDDAAQRRLAYEASQSWDVGARESALAELRAQQRQRMEAMGALLLLQGMPPITTYQAPTYRAPEPPVTCIGNQIGTSQYWRCQ